MLETWKSLAAYAVDARPFYNTWLNVRVDAEYYVWRCGLPPSVEWGIQTETSKNGVKICETHLDFNDICNRAKFSRGLECRMNILILEHRFFGKLRHSSMDWTLHRCPSVSRQLAICLPSPERWLEMQSPRASQGCSLEPTFWEGTLCDYCAHFHHGGKKWGHFPWPED